MIKSFFSQLENDAIVQAIKEAEKNTSGEIRVHIENTCKSDVLDRAVAVFELLGMHKTEARNGVLFYLAVKDRKFAILGDVGINKVVPADFWDKIKENCIENFKKGEFTKGLTEGIKAAGLQLKGHFPYQSNDVNELSDDISFENN